MNMKMGSGLMDSSKLHHLSSFSVIRGLCDNKENIWRSRNPFLFRVEFTLVEQSSIFALTLRGYYYTQQEISSSYQARQQVLALMAQTCLSHLFYRLLERLNSGFVCFLFFLQFLL